MRQAKSLTTGNTGEVLAQNRYSVDNSGWHSFSPYAYPWGWPLIVAPFYTLFGLNYGIFKFLEVVAFCVFLLTFFAIVRRRAGLAPAIVLLLLIGLSPAYIRATDTVLSDLPYLCFVGVTLWWMDRCRREGILLADKRDLIILGLLMAFAFNIRREAMALVLALVGLHLSVLARPVWRAAQTRTVDGLKRIPWRVLAMPYAVAGAAVVAFQLLLPTDFLPSLPGAGLTNASKRLTYYQDSLAESIGLKDPGLKMELFHSNSFAKKILALVVIIAVAGITIRLLNHFDEDILLGAYLLGATFIMLVSPYEEPRYLYTITPFLLYFAYQALPSMVGAIWGDRRRWTTVAKVVPLVGLSGLILLNAADTRRSTDFHRANQYTVNGPELDKSQDMFNNVISKTRGDDVILFFRARALTLYTDRLAVQGSNLEQMLPRVDWYVMEKGSDYSQTDLSDEQGKDLGLEKTWENAGWVLWKVPKKPAP